MAKRRGSHTRRLVSPEKAAQAKWAKAHGLISKRAKTGKTLSRSVEKKIDTLRDLQAVPQYEYREGMKAPKQASPPKRAAVKLKPAQAKAEKQAGYEIVSGHTFINPKDKRAKEVVSKGGFAGVQQVTPGQYREGPVGPERVTPGYVESIRLATFGVSNYRDLHKALVKERLDGIAKNDDEVYSFVIGIPTEDGDVLEFHPKGGRVFFDDKELADYLERYKWTDEKFRHFELVRMQMGESLGPSPGRETLRQIRRAQSRRNLRIKELASGNKQRRFVLTREETLERDRKRHEELRKKRREELGEATYKAREAIGRANRRELRGK